MFLLSTIIIIIAKRLRSQSEESTPEVVEQVEPANQAEASELFQIDSNTCVTSPHDDEPLKESVISHINKTTKHSEIISENISHPHLYNWGDSEESRTKVMINPLYHQYH